MDGSPEDKESVLKEMEKNLLIKPALDYFREKGYNKFIDRMVQFHLEENTKQLRNISNSMFKQELKHIKNIQKYVPQNDMNTIIQADWLILTVGMRKEPLIISILLVSPRKVFLLHTSGSLKTATEVKEHFGDHVEIEFYEIDEVDPSRIYEVTKKIFEDAKESNKKLAFDPTGGRKAMSAGAAAVSFYYSIPMVYLHGFEKNMTMMPFTEQLKLIPNPYDKFGDLQIRIIAELANRYNFADARDMVDIVIKNKLIMLRGQLSILKEVMDGYNEWDRFKHSDKEKRPQISDSLKEALVSGFNLLQDCVKEKIKKNIEFLKKLEQTWQEGERNMVDKYRIVDLYANILRREDQGKLEEGLALAYRLFEMLPFYYLKNKFKDVSSTMKNEELGKLLKLDEEMVDNPKDKITLFSMMKYMKKGLPDDKKVQKLNEYYEKTQEIKEGRNESLFGHGTHPIDKKQFDKVRIIVENAIKELIKDFDKLLKMAKFPDFIEC